MANNLRRGWGVQGILYTALYSKGAMRGQRYLLSRPSFLQLKTFLRDTTVSACAEVLPEVALRQLFQPKARQARTFQS